MNGLAGRVIGWIVAVLLAAGGAFYAYTLRADLVQAQDELENARKTTKERDTTIRRLLARERRNEALNKQLAADNAGIQRDWESRETLIRNLERENIETRTWAAARLPSPVVELLEHGEFIGAGAYRERMSPSPALQPVGSEGGNQR